MLKHHPLPPHFNKFFYIPESISYNFILGVSSVWLNIKIFTQ